MFATRLPIQRQALDYQYWGKLPTDNASLNKTNDSPLESFERGTAYRRQKSTHGTIGMSPTSSQSSSPRLQGSVQCYGRRLSQPVQAADLMNPPYGPYSGPYNSRASSTLPSPSPMTPTTEDMIDQWTGRRRPSDFATSAVASSFSPRSPRDYDFPTGNHLPPSMNGSQQPTPRADLFPEGFDSYQTITYPDNVASTVDSKASCIAMSGPPYPPEILEHNGEVLPESFLDPHVLNMGRPGETYTTPEDVLNLEYGADLQVPSPQGVPYNVLAPAREDEYVNADDNTDTYSYHDPLEDIPQSLPLVSRAPASITLSQPATGQRESSQRLLCQRSANEIRTNSKVQNQCLTCNKYFDTSTKLHKHIRKEHDRPYPCIFSLYGCNSVFGTKNEWSRHIKVQHFRLETWRCNIDECEKCGRDEDHALLPPASKGKSEYDRKDLFLNHVRRCHKDQYPQPGIVEGPRATAYEEQAQQQCHLTLRAPPLQTSCPCCPGTTWTEFDLRLEHIGKAMESNEKAHEGFHDPLLESYMIHEGLLLWHDSGRWFLTGAEGKKGGRQARRGTPKALTTQSPLSNNARRQESTVQPSRKSKRVAQKKELRRRQTQQEENSDEDAEAEDDDDYAGTA